MENENKSLVDKIKDEIKANGGLTSDQIAVKFLGMKNSLPIMNKKIVDKIFKDYREFYFDNEKWQIREIKIWEKAEFSAENFEKEPQSFGVFGFYDENKKIIFVGSATNLCEKLLSFCEENENTPQNIKELHKSAVSYITSSAESEEKALDIEQKLIAKHQPKLNLA